MRALQRRDGESQQPVRDRHQGLRGLPFGANDVWMACVETARQRAERWQDQLSFGRDKTAARDVAAAMGDAEPGMIMYCQFTPGRGWVGFMAKETAVHRRYPDLHTPARHGSTERVVSGDPGPARRGLEGAAYLTGQSAHRADAV